MNNGLYVAISSVVEREIGFKDYRYIAKLAAEGIGFSALRNPEDSGMQQRSFEEYLVKKSPIVLLIVGTEDSTMVRKECKIAIEHCLPLMVFIKKQDHTISSKTTQMMNEISKATYQRDCCCFETSEELFEHVQIRLNDYLKHKISATPSIQPYTGDAYAYSVGMFGNARKRIALYQKTSSLLLGPKAGNLIEKNFNEAMFSWIRNMEPDMEFIHLYSRSQTEAAARDSEKYNLAKAKEELETLMSTPAVCQNRNIVIRELDQEVSTSFFVCDCEILLIFDVGGTNHTVIIPPYIMDDQEVTHLLSNLCTHGVNKPISKLSEFYNGI